MSTQIDSKKPFRIRELKMFNGEIRFVPERRDELSFVHGWERIGQASFYLTMEEAKQQIDNYKLEQQSRSYTETIHEIE